MSCSPKEMFSNCGVRVSLDANQGMRKYMEDEICISSKSDGTAFFGVFDGHGGKEAAIYAKEHLYDNIKTQPEFAATDPEKIRYAIREGFLQTHMEMSRVIDTWPKRKDGFHSTSGTTATIVILRDKRLYVAHVGDSAAVISCKNEAEFEAKELTRDHKPEDLDEKARIESLGGRVVASNTGVHRVVWKRLAQNSRYEYVPFLAVSRALGDLWSYDEDIDEFIVSPEPDISVIDFDQSLHKFLIVASDGLWGAMDAATAVRIVSEYEQTSLLQAEERNSSRHLLQKSLEMWQKRRSRADNISVIVAFFDNEFGNVDFDRVSFEESDTTVEYEDETPQEDGLETCDFRLVRQISFHADRGDALKLNAADPVLPVDDMSEHCGVHNDHSEDYYLGKRKNDDDNLILSNEKKVKLSPSDPNEDFLAP